METRIKAGHGPKEAMKAKAILAPADNDGLEAVFYNFCGVGHSDMDGKGFKKLCQDCSLMDKKLDTTTVDLIFADNRVKPRGMNRIDFYQFEIALELVAEKKVLPKIEVRTAMITQGTPKTVATSTKPTLKVKKVDNARLISEKRIAAILRRSPRELGKDSWKKEVDNKEAQLNLSAFFFSQGVLQCTSAAQKVDTSRGLSKVAEASWGMPPQFIRTLYKRLSFQDFEHSSSVLVKVEVLFDQLNHSRIYGRCLAWIPKLDAYSNVFIAIRYKICRSPCRDYVLRRPVKGCANRNQEDVQPIQLVSFLERKKRTLETFLPAQSLGQVCK